MHIISNLGEWIAMRNQLSTHDTLGFAPTMGNLHAGHASLFRASSAENTYTVSSLFINPTQFNNPEDFTHYPRTLEADIELMKQSGVDFCLLPTKEDLYPDHYNYQLHENELSQYMEGKHRPGHFNGVLTVVMKLFQITRPHKAYFGEKDYQQWMLIDAMVKAFFMPITIIPCPTIREPSGLAYSSRNNRLDSEQKARANQFAEIFHQQAKSCDSIIQELSDLGIIVEYVEEYHNRRFAAVVIGGIRLIDNYAI